MGERRKRERREVGERRKRERRGRWGIEKEGERDRKLKAREEREVGD